MATIDALTNAAGDMAAGTPEDDVFLVQNKDEPSSADVISGGSGTDTLLFQFAYLSETYDFRTADRMGDTSSVEVLDFSGIHGGPLLDLKVDAHAFAQAGGTLTLATGGLDVRLSTAQAEGAAVRVAGTGLVTLHSSQNQVVAVADGFDGRIEGSASASDDILTGGTGNDTISGGGGDDRISGGTGTNTLTGGAGADWFRIAGGSGNTITDYVSKAGANGIDIVDLRGVGSASAGNTTVAAGSGGAVVSAGDARIVLSGLDASEVNVANFLFADPDDPKAIRIAAGADEGTIQAVIDKAEAGTVIELGAGTFTFTETLRIGRSDITLKGAAGGKTIIRSEIPLSAESKEIITVQSRETNDELGKLAVTAAAGSTKIELRSAAGLKVGDAIYVGQANDAATLKKYTDPGIVLPTKYFGEKAANYYLREAMLKIEKVEGNTVTLSKPLPFTFEKDVAFASKVNALTDVAISDLKIQTSLGRPDPLKFENTIPGWGDQAAVSFDRVMDSSIKNVSTQNTGSHAFSFSRVYGLSGDHLSADGSHNKGEEGSGYGFYFLEAFANDFKHLTVKDMRHSVLFSSWSAEHYNDIQVDWTNRDINFHGGPDADNTVIVDRMVASYKLGADTWPAVGPGAPLLHPLSLIEENTVLFRYARTWVMGETLNAADGGADIDSGGGKDRINGGSGADTLKGGADNDVVHGNNGDDKLLSGDAGLDKVFGGNGKDTLKGGADSDVLDGESGADKLWGDAGDDLLRLGAGDRGTGGKGSDTFVITGNAGITDFAVSDILERIDLRAIAKAKSFDALEIRQSGSAAKVSVGGIAVTLENVRAKQLSADNFLFRGDNDSSAAERHTRDALEATTKEADKLKGTAGDDVFDASTVRLAPNDAINGMGGFDTLRITSTNVSMDASKFKGLTSIEEIDVSQAFEGISLALDAAMVRQSGKTLGIYAGAYDVTLDTSKVGNAGTVVIETAGTVKLRSLGSQAVTLGDGAKGTVLGSFLDDRIGGGKRGDHIWGSAGHDVLAGNGGDDRLEGGADADRLSGGAGNDTFVFNTRVTGPDIVDAITDFSNAKGNNDGFELHQEFFAALKAGQLEQSMFKTIADAASLKGVDADDRILYDKAAGDLFYDADGSGRGGRLKFADLAPNTELSHLDFLIVA